jgi:hypothetical protein
MEENNVGNMWKIQVEKGQQAEAEIVFSVL